jgi:Fur family transcriptional regulator, peroxide stress response regulator
MTTSDTRLDDLIARLRESGHRLTPQRMAVIKTLIGNREHLNAEQIYDRVRVDFPMTSLATVYKTVLVLKEMGAIQEISFDGEGKHFDGGSSHAHPHVICTKCRRIEDLDLADLNLLPADIARQTGYRIEGHRLDFFGVCPDCQKKEADHS